VPASWDRIEILSLSAAGKLEISDFDHWSAPLAQIARQTLSDDLDQRLPSGSVIYPRLPKPDGALGIDVDILEFTIVASQASMRASWLIVPAAGSQSAKRSVASLQESMASTEAAAVAHAVERIDRPVGRSYRRGRSLVQDTLTRCRRSAMYKLLQSIAAALVLAGVSAGVARADSYDDTIHTFQAGRQERHLFRQGVRICRVSDRRRRRLRGGGGSWKGSSLRARGPHGRHDDESRSAPAFRRAPKPTARSFSLRTSVRSTNSRVAISNSERMPAPSPLRRQPKRVRVPAASAPKPARSRRTPTPAAAISTAWRCSRSPKAA
jgi:hypothetical protein